MGPVGDNARAGKYRAIDLARPAFKYKPLADPAMQKQALQQISKEYVSRCEETGTWRPTEDHLKSRTSHLLDYFYHYHYYCYCHGSKKGAR